MVGFSFAAVFAVIYVIMIIVAMLVFTSSYKKVGPNKAMVLFRGNRSKNPTPHRVIHGSGKFIIPGGETFEVLDLSAQLVEFELTGVSTKGEHGPVKVRLKVAAIFKVNSDPDILKKASQHLVDKTQGENRIFVKDVLERGIVSLVATLTDNSIHVDRGRVTTKVLKEVDPDLTKEGLEVLTLQFLNIKPQG